MSELSLKRAYRFEQPFSVGGKLRILGVLLVVSALAAIALSPGVLLQLLLMLEGLLLFRALRHPLYAVGALIINEVSILYYRHFFGTFEISNRLLIAIAVVVIALLLAPTFTSKASIGPRAKYMYPPALALLVFIVLAQIQNVDGEELYTFMRFILTGYVALLLIPLLVHTRDDLKRLALVVLPVLALSALVAVMQHFWTYGLPIYETTPGAYGNWQGRSMGLNTSPIILSNVMLIAVSVFGALAFSLTLAHRWGRYFLIFAVLAGLALFFTYTRSGLYSLAAGVLVFPLLLKGHARKEVIAALLILGPVFGAFLILEETRLTLTGDSSSAGRAVLWTAGARMALDNPLLGVGSDGFLRLASSYGADIELPDALAAVGADEVLGRFQVHNDFLHVWLSFGPGALIAYLMLLWAIVTNYYLAHKRATDPWMKGVALGLLAGTIAYVANTTSHNGFDTTILLWILAGLSIVVLRVSGGTDDDAVGRGDADRARFSLIRPGGSDGRA